MWWFNPGNPVRGQVKYAEEDAYPGQYMQQVSLPAFYRMTVPADAKIATEWSEAAGEILLERRIPNGYARQIQGLLNADAPGDYGGDSFDYIQIANYSELPVIYDVIVGSWGTYDNPLTEATYVTSYDSTIGETRVVGTSLTQAAVVALFESETGQAPLDVKSRTVLIVDFWPSFYHDASFFIQYLQVKMPAGTELLVSSAMGYNSDSPTEEDPGYMVKTILENPGTPAYWVLAWRDSMVSIMSRPFLQFAHVAIYDVIEPAVLPDAMRAFTVEGHEILGAGDSVIRGGGMGKLTVKPGWL